MSTFREYLVESGFTFEQYAEEVRDALVKLGDRYKNADLYFYEELEEAYNNNAEVNATAADIASKFDEAFTLKMKKMMVLHLKMVMKILKKNMVKLFLNW